jgi:hypothetical protein
MIGIAAGYGGAVLLLSPFTILVVGRLTGLDAGAYARAVLGPATLAAAMAALVLAVTTWLDRLGASNLLQVAVGVLIGIPAYLGLLLWRRPRAFEDALLVVRSRGRR